MCRVRITQSCHTGLEILAELHPDLHRQTIHGIGGKQAVHARSCWEGFVHTGSPLIGQKKEVHAYWDLNFLPCCTHLEFSIQIFVSSPVCRMLDRQACRGKWAVGFSGGWVLGSCGSWRSHTAIFSLCAPVSLMTDAQTGQRVLNLKSEVPSVIW